MYILISKIFLYSQFDLSFIFFINNVMIIDI